MKNHFDNHDIPTSRLVRHPINAVKSSEDKQNGKEADIDNDLECDSCFTTLETLMDLELHIKSHRINKYISM